MRILVIIVFLLFIAAGIVLGALNAEMVSYDFGFMQVGLPKGAALLGAVVLGWLLGGLAAWLGVVTRQRGIQRRQRRDAGKKIPASS
jgi:uncharacterized integral membrane protein